MQPPKYYYETLSEAVDDLVKRGYNTDFLINDEKECIVCGSKNIELSPDDFEIDEVYRFEGMSDPEDSSIVFAISSKKNEIKGVVVNSFGADFSYRSSKLVEHLLRNSR